MNDRVDRCDTAPADGPDVRSAPYLGYPDGERTLLVFTLFLVATLGYADRNVLVILLEGIKAEFGLSDASVGLLTGAPFAILFAVASLPVSRWADRHDRKIILIASMIGWSLATLVCGMAGSLTILIAARMALGAAEAGIGPTMQALVADYCAPTQRSRAYAALTAASAIGAFVALTGGGTLAVAYGWRAAFVGMAALALPSLVVALLVLREPRHGRGSGGPRPDRRAWPADIGKLAAKRSYVLLTANSAIYGLVANGPLLLAPLFMIRVLKADAVTAGRTIGSAVVLGTLAGAVAGGLIGDRCVHRDTRWLTRLPAAGFAMALVTSLVAFDARQAPVFVVASGLTVAVLTAALPVLYTAVHAVCGSPRRAIATAILLGATSVFGMSLGPLLLGVLSDRYAAGGNPDGLRGAALTVVWLLVPASLLALAAGRTLRRDMEI